MEREIDTYGDMTAYREKQISGCTGVYRANTRNRHSPANNESDLGDFDYRGTPYVRNQLTHTKQYSIPDSTRMAKIFWMLVLRFFPIIFCLMNRRYVLL